VSKFGSASGRAGNGLELMAFMAGKEHPRRDQVNRALRPNPR
jgi:hypothetical protein